MSCIGKASPRSLLSTNLSDPDSHSNLSPLTFSILYIFLLFEVSRTYILFLAKKRENKKGIKVLGQHLRGYF